ncbi:MAG: aminotransferase class V-fold PLP-dependent enzyme [Proteobacteria bacterium]|nr:aminotransferase class V-fold PLP-dependent enzyme [Pseudomonadota bacterium]
MKMNRREAIRNLTYSAALFGLPASVVSAQATSLPSTSLLDGDAERYWNRLREEQFLMPGKRAFLNTGSVGVAARPVVQAVCNYLEQSAALQMEGLHAEDRYPRWGYETLDKHRSELAHFVGCEKDELAITHNATEAMSIIAGGMPLEKGAEILITDQEHPSGREPWRVREAKGEVTVRTVALPLPPESPAQLADIVVSAIGPKTRVLSFSGITSSTGLLMPIREICDAARAQGVSTVVDGAHMTGQVAYRIADMNCDYFAGSPHKWLFAPVGSGLLYIREERLDLHYPVIATAGWDDKSLKAGRFMRFGTNNRAIVEGFMAGLHFAQAIGPERIYQRIHQLAQDTYARARALPYTEMLTPEDDSMYGSLVTFRLKLPEKKLNRLWQLCADRMIWTTSNPQLRISTHIHTRKSDLDLFFETLSEAAA